MRSNKRWATKKSHVCIDCQKSQQQVQSKIFSSHSIQKKKKKELSFGGEKVENPSEQLKTHRSTTSDTVGGGRQQQFSSGIYSFSSERVPFWSSSTGCPQLLKSGSWSKFDDQDSSRSSDATSAISASSRYRSRHPGRGRAAADQACIVDLRGGACRSSTSTRSESSSDENFPGTGGSSTAEPGARPQVMVNPGPSRCLLSVQRRRPLYDLAHFLASAVSSAVTTFAITGRKEFREIARFATPL